MDGQESISVPAAMPAPEASTNDCPECGARSVGPPEQFVYAIGRLDVRFPSVGIEREFQQRQARLAEPPAAGTPRGKQIRQVLEVNRHLVNRVCYVFMISGIPAFVVVAPSAYVRDELFEAIEHSADADQWCVLIGRRGPMAGPTVCAGVLAPIVACDQLYAFSINEWRESLAGQVTGVIEAKGLDPHVFATVTQELFTQIVNSTENLGAADTDRALNYLVMQHPGIFLAAVERSGKHSLEKIETRVIHGLGTRRLVAVILTFVDLNTGVPERLFCRVDVTEEWPFVAEGDEGRRRPRGLMPFVENALLGMAY